MDWENAVVLLVIGFNAIHASGKLLLMHFLTYRNTTIQFAPQNHGIIILLLQHSQILLHC